MTEPAPELTARPGLAYQEIYRAGRRGWWWSLAGIVTLAALTLVVVPFVVVLGFVLWFLATGGGDLYDRTLALADTDQVTPGVLLFLNLCLIGAIPVSWFCIRVFHGLKPRWLASVAPRIRWRWLAVSFAIAFVSLVVAVAFGALLPASGEAGSLGGEANAFTTTTRDFLIVIVLFTPLQAVAEEYAFRGYLTQAFGGLVRSPLVAVLAPALLFALAHGAQSLPVFVDRFAFGVVSGVLVIVTGGLEAGIAMHVLNNVLAYGLALTFSDMTTALNPTGGSWWDILATLVKSLVFLGLSLLAARRMGLQTRTAPGVLEPSHAPV